MKKFLLLMAVTLTLGLTTRAADGDEFTVDNLKYKVLSEEDQTASLVGYEVEPTGELVIPQLVKNGSSRYAVTTIGFGAFNGCSDMTAVTIPNTVTKIVEHAFHNCDGLTAVTIPSSVTSISPVAFRQCSNLKEISVAEGNTNYISVDGVLFNKAKTSIIIYPIAKGSSYEIPSSVTTIGEYAFEGCIGLTSVTIPESVITIDEYAFDDCIGLTSVTIPESVITIGSGAFYNCSGLTSVTIPNSMTVIGNTAFNGCSGLTSVTIPNSVAEIGYCAFADCKALTSVYCYALIPPTIHVKAFDYVNTSDVILHVVKGAEAAYKEADVWKDFLILADLAPQSGIEGIEADGSDLQAEFFNLNGVRVNGEALTPGLYIKRQDGNATKVLVK
ncbi:MAG: leucine-rich repeat domain-containing protein [Alistipes timonensis]|nr:leucine-rich repeat domain-containing protein [Alistipes timonensis]